MSDAPPAPGASPLGEIALLFLKLGVTSFGGPVVHISMMEDEVVAKRRWMTRERFLDLVGATNMIPGPNSTEMAIHIGHVRGGWPGLLVAGSAFILPPTAIVLALAWGYARYGALPQAAGMLYALKPVVMAVIVQALWRLAPSALKSWTLAVIGLAAATANAFGVDEVAVLLGSGLLAALIYQARRGASMGLLVVPFLQGSGTAAGAAPAAGLWPLFGFFLKVGSVLFGSGYVLIAFLHGGLVDQRAWLTEAQLLDAVAVGQITPGPLSTTATFIGYLLAGVPGAGVATLGMFLPAFVFVALSAPLVPRLRRSPAAGAVLDGVNVASLALMGVVAFVLATEAFVDPLTIALGIVSAGLLIRYRVNTGWLVLGAAIIGLFSY